MTVVVTGARGYLGARVADAIERTGGDVRRLGRAEAPLGSAPPVLDGVHALVHAAWDFAPRTWREIARVNVDGSVGLIDAARNAGVERIVFISTLSAFPGCPSMYGRAKLAVEEHVRSLGGIAVRPGLVWGRPGGSLYARLAAVADRAPVLPVFTGRPLHLAHEDDVADLVASLALGGFRGGEVVPAAAPGPITLGEILRRIGAAHGRTVRVIPLPWQAAWAGLRALELAGRAPPFRSDSVRSLVGLQRDPFGADGPPPGFRPFSP